MQRRIIPWLILCGVFAVFSIGPNRSQAAEPMKDLPSAARVILAKAGKLMQDKEYGRAASLIVDFQSQASKAGEVENKGCLHPEVYSTLGTCYLFDNQFLQAARNLDLALQKDPHHLAALLNRAKAAYELHDYLKATESFARAYEAAPEKNPEYLYFAAVAALLAKENKKSIALFEKILTIHPQAFLPEWRENLVHAFLAAGENRRALPHIKALSETYRDAKQVQWQEILLQQYLQLDMGSEALALADMLIARTPTQPKWWRALVHIHLQHNRYQPALAALLVTGYLEPLSEQEKRLTADLYLQLGVPRQAVPVYESMLKEKNNAQLLTNLIIALQQAGQSEQALTALEKFAPATISPELSMLKADLLYSLGKFKDAVHLYQKTAAASTSKQRDRALQMAKYAKIHADNAHGFSDHRLRTATF